MSYPVSFPRNFRHKIPLKKKKKDIYRMKLFWTLRVQDHFYAVTAVWQPAIFYFELYKNHIYIHHSPST